jgi:hypothetical protein
MRITIGLTAIASLCLLAGCNKGAANNSANAPAPAANVTEPAPAANAVTPAAPGFNRENEITECSADMSSHVAPGSDVAALCGCAVDRIQGGARQSDAVTQCAAQLHITMAAGEGGGEGGAAQGNSE